MIQSPDEFAALINENSGESRFRARSDTASVKVWSDVIEQFPELKIDVIWNKTVPIEILDRLSLDSNSEVRGWVATKRKLTQDMFERLASDPSDHVRSRLAENANVPVHLLKRLCNDVAPQVAEDANNALRSRQQDSP